MSAAYYLGCPVWACDKWLGSLYSRDARREDWLGEYAQVFGTVEGNSTFYGLPSHDTVRRWAASVGAGFRFVFKFPRTISHDKRLRDAERETQDFLALLEILAEADCLGPSFLQLPSGFSGYHVDDLVGYLERLPRQFPYAVELRHHDYFDSGAAEDQLNRVLAELGIDRVILDSRPLFSAPAEDEFEEASQARKPQVPVHLVLTGTRPLVRLIGRDDLRRLTPWILQWSRTTAKWIHGGMTPYIFTHTPDERFAPQFARLFHEELSRHVDRIRPLPPWPGEGESDSRQLRLF
jgi:uncharacterized protein YecE (DUF72 family)